MASPRVAPLTFDDLSHRLVRDLGKLVRSGAVTERRLAGMVGLSQSHLHNVVNGLRALTPAVADQVMERLDWSLLDLVESAEAIALLSRRQASQAHGCEIPLFQEAVGVGFQFPGKQFSDISVPNSWLARAENPVAVSAGADAEMESLVAEGEILLIDRAPAVRAAIYEDALYVVRWGGDSLVRGLRFGSRGVYLVTACDWGEPARWTMVVRPHSQRLDIVEGRIIAIAQPPDGTFRRPALPFASS